DRAAVELAAVQLLDGCRGLFRCAELHERETPRATGVAVGRNRYVQHLADRREELADLFLPGVEAEIADEHFERDGVLPFFARDYPRPCGGNSEPGGFGGLGGGTAERRCGGA